MRLGYRVIATSVMSIGLAMQSEVATGLSDRQGPCERAMALIVRGDLEGLRSVLPAGLDPNCRLSDRSTLLMAAAEAGQSAAARMLVQVGADVNAFNDNGWTPLMFAISTGAADIVEWLLESGADVSRRATDGMTALDLARKRTRRYLQFPIPFTSQTIFINLPLGRTGDGSKSSQIVAMLEAHMAKVARS